MTKEYIDKLKKFSIFQKTEEKRDKDLLIAASVIAAMAYQAVLSPPAGMASLDAAARPKDELVTSAKDYLLKPGRSLLVSFYPGLSSWFWINNTVSLIASLTIIFLYVSGFSLKRQIQIWVIRVAMWVTVTTMAVAYVCGVVATVNPVNAFDEISNTAKALVIVLIVWIALVYTSLTIHVYRFFVYLKNSRAGAPSPTPRETEMIDNKL